MPFLAHATMETYISDDDALAIKAYLFTLPPVRAKPRQHTGISVQPALGDDVLVGSVQ